MDFDRAKLQTAMASLAAKGVYIGTSSWKYPGWCGMIYDESKYITRGKVAGNRAKRWQPIRLLDAATASRAKPPGKIPRSRPPLGKLHTTGRAIPPPGLLQSPTRFLR